MFVKSFVFAACVGISVFTGCIQDSGPDMSETGQGAGPSWEEFQANPPMSWEAFRAAAAREPFPPYRFIVDGDIVLPDEQELRQHYQAWLAQEYSSVADHGSELTVRRVLGADVLWSTTDRRNLTYCISNSFGTDKAALVTAMDLATRSWSDLIGVKFIYRSSEDAACNYANTNVMFNVRPVTSTAYYAAAFFPDYPRGYRELLVTSAAFTDTTGGRDLQGILRHETGHILGFQHEHIWITCTGETTAESRQVTLYDVNSVMHYPQCRPSGTGGYRQSALDYTGALTLYGPPILL